MNTNNIKSDNNVSGDTTNVSDLVEEPYIFKFYWQFLIFYLGMLACAFYLYAHADKNPSHLIGVIFFPYLYIPWAIGIGVKPN